MKTSMNQITEAVRFNLNKLIEAGSTIEAAMQALEISPGLRQRILYPKKGFATATGCFDVEGYVRESRGII